MKEKLTQKEFIKLLADKICQGCKGKDVFIVGISGPDVAGKTQTSKKLATKLKNKKVNVVCVPSDWFHYPRSYRRDAPGKPDKQFLFHTIDFDRLIKEVLKPIRQKKKQITFTHFNVDTNKKKKEILKLHYPLVLLVEGIFLFQKKLVDFFDFRVYLKVNPETRIKRAIVRDRYRFGKPEEVKRRYEAKYNKGQKLHKQIHKPLKYAHWVVNNNNWKSPTIVKKSLLTGRHEEG